MDVSSHKASGHMDASSHDVSDHMDASHDVSAVQAAGGGEENYTKQAAAATAALGGLTIDLLNEKAEARMLQLEDKLSTALHRLETMETTFGRTQEEQCAEQVG